MKENSTLSTVEVEDDFVRNEILNEEEIEGDDEGDLQVDDTTTNEGVVIEKNDRSLSDFHRWKKSGRLIVDPEWQRQYVWDRRRASKLVESFLYDIPVPVVYLAKNNDGKYEVIDGLQRLTSIFDYFDNKYPLRGLELLSDNNNKKFEDLDENSQNKLLDTTLRTFELAPRTPKDLMFIIFERLNTGGIKLNDMEIRNCLFRGKLNILIKELALNQDFITAINQKNIAKRMADRNLVLRFLAFYERTPYKAKQGLKKFLNEFFETYRNVSDSKAKEYEKKFKKSMRAIVTIFGDRAFRLRREGKNEKQEWAARPNAAIFQTLSTSFADYDLGQLTRRADSIYEEYVDLVSTDAKWREYVRIATGEPTRLSYVFETWNERLKKAIGKGQPNDSSRCFSRQLKEDMFNQNNTCAICEQKITLVLDAALDHDIHYWRGGETIPDNARLVHRHCNLTRSNQE